MINKLNVSFDTTVGITIEVVSNNYYKCDLNKYLYQYL